MNDFHSQLEEAIADLYWIGESDEPWGILSLDGQPNEDAIAQLSGKTPVEIKNFENFFANATKEQDWHDEEEKADVQRYRVLVKLLKENLVSIMVYRAGEIEVDIFVTGKTDDGKWIALKTLVVET